MEKRLAVYYFTSFYLASNYGTLFLHSPGGQMSKDEVSAGFGPSFCIIQIYYKFLKFIYFNWRLITL